MNKDEQIENLMRIAENATGLKGYGVTAAFHGAVKQLIAQETTKARIKETKLWYNDWGNGKEQIGDGSWEDFYEWRIAELQKELDNAK